MWAEINGERKKVACGPCIRGHRSSKCDHRDRVLVEVRKPGRPLSSCPHPSGSCSCERVVINYTIPKTSECACPPERSQPAVVAGNGGRVQKSRTRKSTTTLTPDVLEKAIKAAQDAETDSSSLLTRTPTSESNDASSPSSASSTPRILPSRKESHSSDLPMLDQPVSTSRPTTSSSKEVSSCCKPKPIQVQTQPYGGSCCSNKGKEAPKPIQPVPPKNSCCSGPASSQPAPPQFASPHGHPKATQNYANFAQFPAQFQHPPYGMMNQGSSYMAMPPPLSFHTPIYNHIASSYQPPSSLPMTPVNSHAPSHAPEHNCHCGESCNCFGCAAHPNNATMMEYIRSMHQYMSTGGFGSVPPPTYDIPAYPHHAGFGAEASLAYNNPTPANYLASQVNFQTNIHHTMSMPPTPVTASSAWPQSSIQAPAQPTTELGSQFFGITNDITPTTTRDANSPLKAEDPPQSPTFIDSPGDGKDENTPTLSPSSYFWQEMVLPGCNDATGTCQCGDGCECVGCLTHGGHNGVPLEASTASEQDPFPELTTGTELGGNNPNEFLSFSNAPS